MPTPGWGTMGQLKLDHITARTFSTDLDVGAPVVIRGGSGQMWPS